MPVELLKLFHKYAEFHPIFGQNIKEPILGKPLFWFHADHFIYWIWAWTYSVKKDELNLDCLIRNTHCKWWKNYPLAEKLVNIKQEVLSLEKIFLTEKQESEQRLKTAGSLVFYNPISALKEKMSQDFPQLSGKAKKLKIFQKMQTQLLESFKDDPPMEEDGDDIEDVNSLSEKDKQLLTWCNMKQESTQKDNDKDMT